MGEWGVWWVVEVSGVCGGWWRGAVDTGGVWWRASSANTFKRSSRTIAHAVTRLANLKRPSHTLLSHRRLTSHPDFTYKSTSTFTYHLYSSRMAKGCTV